MLQPAELNSHWASSHQSGCLAVLLETASARDQPQSEASQQLLHLQMNGLKLSNSWAGYHVLLNPDFSSSIQWCAQPESCLGSVQL